MIINSSPLIIFGKLNKLEMLKNVFKEIFISEAVYKEVVEEGILKKSPEALIIKGFIENGDIKIKKLDKKWKEKAEFLESTYNYIDYGEAETIALVLQENQKSVLIDDRAARDVAVLYGIKPLGSLRVLLLGYQKEIIKEDDLKEIIKKMIQNNFRIGADVMNEFWD